jgi:hypothetical protein
MARILAQMGLRAVADDGADCAVQVAAVSEPWYLWPCNSRTWSVWCGIQTQWRTGLSGVTGLDYAGAWVVVERLIPRRRRDEVFAHLQDMERAVLQVQAERHEQ